MLTAVNTLFTSLFGSVLVSWITAEPIMYLIGLIIFGMIIHFVISLFKL